MRSIRMMFLLGLAALSACYYDNKEELYPTACVDLDVTWTTGVQPIIQAKCAFAGCHDDGVDPPGNFNNLSDVQARAADIRAFAVEPGGVMPPAGQPQLTNCEKKQLEGWLDAGTPNN